MASYLASGNTESSGAEFTLTDGQTAKLCLTAPAGSQRVAPGCRARVEYKTSDSVWLKAGELTADDPVKVLVGAGTYRVTRKASTNACGVDKD